MSVQPVEIELGYDRFEAMAITNEAKARGYKVELVLVDGNGLSPSLAAPTPHRLLVLPHERDAVAELAEGGHWRDYVEWEGRIEDLPKSAPILLQLAAAAIVAMVVLILASTLVWPACVAFQNNCLHLTAVIFRVTITSLQLPASKWRIGHDKSGRHKCMQSSPTRPKRTPSW